MKNYDHRKIEKKWQKEWDKARIYFADDKKSKRKKFYPLIEFPYPSADGLHVGHIRSFTGMDIIARKKRMEGYNVLYPIGWDAFGLPAENYAIKTGQHPKVITKKNIATFKRQMKSAGLSFDWSREVNTTDPEYYKWTQWIFLQFFKHGLAYKAKSNINWCIKCKIGLANEEVINGKCERCGGDTEKREKKQWMLAITKYADRLDKDLDLVDYPDRVKIQQRNWIGKSIGVEIDFRLITDEKNRSIPINSPPSFGEGGQGGEVGGNADNLDSQTHPATPSSLLPLTKGEDGWRSAENVISSPTSPLSFGERGQGGEVEIKDMNTIGQLDYIDDYHVKIFTTRPDTVLGVTYMVLAPEHELIQKLRSNIKNYEQVENYILSSKKKSEMERVAENREKTGIEILGIKALNPANQEEVPIWIADYVLVNYGTGAIMAVPKHDARDLEFAKKYNLPISENPLVNSEEITKKVGGKFVTKYKLRDWVFSRQRYWGEPIPLVFCDKCGWVPIPDKELPVKLPNIKNYKPTDTGESPLSAIKKWVQTKCPKCRSNANRETDVMPNWAGSSWYFLAYIMKKNYGFKFPMQKYKKAFKKWLPVDWYNGGMEHTTLHLLYSRFWHKFLYDLKLVPTLEPYRKRTSQGMVLGEGGVKMSKSIGNVVNPDEIIKNYGADTLRIYEMFMGPFEEATSWSTENIIGSRRFLEKVWRLKDKVSNVTNINSSNSKNLATIVHKTIKIVTDDIEKLNFNTAISNMMILANEFEKQENISKVDFELFIKILAPFAPHITEEIWQNYLHKNKNKKKTKSIHISLWPKHKESLLKESKVKIAVQVNSKVRAEIIIDVDSTEEDVKKIAMNNESIVKLINGLEVKRIIYIKNRLINIIF